MNFSAFTYPSYKVIRKILLRETRYNNWGGGEKVRKLEPNSFHMSSLVLSSKNVIIEFLCKEMEISLQVNGNYSVFSTYFNLGNFHE